MGQSGSMIRFEAYLSKIQLLGQPIFITPWREELPLLVILMQPKVLCLKKRDVKKIIKLGKSKTRKGGLGNKERPGESKT
jgi:hypothetical protein